MLVEQEQKLSELGYCVKRTFVEAVPTTFGEAVRRANSDPTPSSSCSSRSASSDSQRDPSSGSVKQASLRSKDARKQAAAQAPTEGRVVFGSEEARLRERAAAKGLDLAEVLAQVPLDQDGRLTSIGSKAHSSGKCKPCAFSEALGSQSGGGAAPDCLEGVFCRFCHFPHATKPKIRLRPCKSRRERMKKLSTKASAAAESAQQDGLEYDVFDAKNMPEWIQKKPLHMQYVQSVVAYRVAKSAGSPLDSQEHLDQSVEMRSASPRAIGGSSPAASSSSMPHALTTMPPGMHRAARTDGLAGANITRFSL